MAVGVCWERVRSQNRPRAEETRKGLSFGQLVRRWRHPAGHLRARYSIYAVNRGGEEQIGRASGGLRLFCEREVRDTSLLQLSPTRGQAQRRGTQSSVCCVCCCRIVKNHPGLTFQQVRRTSGIHRPIAPAFGHHHFAVGKKNELNSPAVGVMARSADRVKRPIRAGLAMTMMMPAARRSTEKECCVRPRVWKEGGGGVKCVWRAW